MSTASAMRSTRRICLIAPGLKEMWGKPPARRSAMSWVASSGSGAPAETVTPSKGAPLARALGTHLPVEMCLPQALGSRNMVLNCTATPGSSSSVRRARLSWKMASVTWPPPASSDQWPALAAAATISGSTVVGVMPASSIGLRPVTRVNLVTSRLSPSCVTTRGAYCAYGVGRAGARPASKSCACPSEEATAKTPTPRPRTARSVSATTPSAGPRSRIHCAPASVRRVISAGQSTKVVSTAWAAFLARSASRPQSWAQATTCSTAGASAGWWKPICTSSGLTRRLGAAPPRRLASMAFAVLAAAASSAATTRSLSAGAPTSTTCSRPLSRPTTHSSVSPAAAMASSTRSRDAPARETIGEDSPARTNPAARAARAPAAPMSWAMASSWAAVARPSARYAASAPWECPATATAPVRCSPWRRSDSAVAVWAARIPGTDTAAACVSIPDGASVAHPTGSKPCGRAAANASATGAKSSSASARSAETVEPTPAASAAARLARQS